MTYRQGNFEWQFSEDDIVNGDDFIPSGPQKGVNHARAADQKPATQSKRGNPTKSRVC